MKWHTIFTLAYLVVVSCTSVQTPTPSAGLVGLKHTLAFTPTYTPMPTQTSVPTSASTSTLTPTITQTSTRTPTATPDVPYELLKPPEGVVVFESNLRDLDRSKFPSGVDKRRGADFQTGSFEEFGLGMVTFPQGDPVAEQTVEGRTQYKRRGYPTFYPWGFEGGLEGAHSISVDVMVNDLNRLPIRNALNGPWLSVLSHYGWLEGYKGGGAQATAIVNIEPSDDRKLIAALYTLNLSKDGKGLAVPRERTVANAPRFELGKRYRLELVVRADRTMTLYQTSLTDSPDKTELVSEGILGSSNGLGIKGGHGGWYSGDGISGKVYNANLRIKEIN